MTTNADPQPLRCARCGHQARVEDEFCAECGMFLRDLAALRRARGDEQGAEQLLRTTREFAPAHGVGVGSTAGSGEGR